MTKLSKKDIREIVGLRDNGFSLRRIGELYGVAHNTVWKRLNKLSTQDIDKGEQ